MPTRILTPALLLLALAGGCLDPKPVDGTSGGDDTGSPDTEDGPSIYDINDGTIPMGETVTLSGVVVTSPVNRDGDGFFVAAPDGGPGSGLFVWRQSGLEGMIVYDGDEMRITGTATDYYGWTEFVVDSLDDIEVTGEVAMPAPVELADGAGVDWEQYESVVVTLEAQTVTSIDEFNTGTLSGGILLDDGFEYLDYDCRGSWASVTGVVFYQYEEHSLNPRSDLDFGTYTAPVAAPTTIAAIQNGEMCGPVTVEGVVATAPDVLDGEDTTFFVQDAGGGPNSGIAAFAPAATLDVNVGDVLTITGSADEFYGFSQIYIADVTTAEITGAGGTPVGESLSEAPADWEAYEGSLITLGGLEVTSDQTYGEVETNYGIKLDDLYYEHGAANGDTFSSVTGVLYYTYSEWKIEPRDAADLVP